MATTFERFKQTLSIRLLGWTKIPLLASVRPTVVELDPERCVIRIPLRRWSRNHLGSMYFGALAIGADIAGGLLAVEQIRKAGAKVSLAFKSFRAEGAKVRDLVARTLASEERLGEMVRIQAAVRLPDGSYDPVAEFTLELTLKKSSKGAI